MLFKKYVFETQHTKLKRKTIGFILFLICLGFIYIFLGLYTLQVARNENQGTKDFYFKKSPDLLVIYTGDVGRIPYGIEKALEFKSRKVFISGVYNSNTIKDVMEFQFPNYLKKNSLDHNAIEIDYLAQNTIENVFSTIRLLRHDPTLKKVIIISSDYHILRIKILMYMMWPKEGEKIDIHYLGLESDYSQWRNIKILMKEILKTIKGLCLILFWENDIIAPHRWSSFPFE
jgi:uncharacterized SAM-binding protein YcdF (DUF218 family)